MDTPELWSQAEMARRAGAWSKTRGLGGQERGHKRRGLGGQESGHKLRGLGEQESGQKQEG